MRVVQIEPGPTPTLTASAPAKIKASAASEVAMLPAITTWLGNFGFERIEPKFGNETYRQPLFKNLFIIMKNGKAFQIVSQIGQNDWQIMGIKIDKVHLLQNKWAILTNIDLKLNLIK